MRQWERKKPGSDAHDATISNPLVDHVEVAALEALDPPRADRAATAGGRTIAHRRRDEPVDGRGRTQRTGALASGPMTVHERPFGRCLEDFVVGDVYRHWPGKTITEYDDHLFCMITMNHHPLHTNDWFAGESVQGRNVVVGNLVYSLVLGHERARRQRRGDRQPRGRDAAAQVPDVPRRHDPRRDPGARGQGVVVATRPGHRHRRVEGLQPGRPGGLLLPPQGDGLEARRPPPIAPAPTTTRAPPGTERTAASDVSAAGRRRRGRRGVARSRCGRRGPRRGRGRWPGRARRRRSPGCGSGRRG